MNRLLAASFKIENNFSPAQQFSNLGQLATDAIKILSGAGAVISIFFIIFAGLKFITSGGDQKKLASASGTITYAIIGLAVTVLAFVILELVQYFLQSNVPIE